MENLWKDLKDMQKTDSLRSVFLAVAEAEQWLSCFDRYHFHSIQYKWHSFVKMPLLASEKITL